MREHALASLRDRTKRSGEDALDVLVVDDHDISRRLAGAMLQAFGARPTGAASGEEALELADVRAFDVALVDFGLPDMDGLALCEALAARPGLSRGAVVAMTGRARPEVLPPVLAGWLEKPFSVRDLHAALAAAHGLRRAG